jgi:hypothetical protein
MILAKMKLDEAFVMDFEMVVQGTAEKAEQVRFIIEGKEFDVICRCERDGDNVKVTIPKLKGIIESGSYDIRMETIIDGRIFTPLQESIEFIPLVEFDVKKTKGESIKEGVTVKLKNTDIVSEDMKSPKNKLEDNLRKVMEEGYDVSKIDEHFVIKQGDLYMGLISENGIHMVKKAHSSYLEMLKEIK